MKRSYLVTLCVCAAACAGFYIWNRPYIPNASNLLARALSARQEDDRVNAVVELATLTEPEVGAQLLRVANESRDPKVQVAAIIALSARNTRSNLPCYYKAMNHEEKTVRQAAYAASLKYWGSGLPGNLTYEVDDPQEKRTEVTSRLQDLYMNPKGGAVVAAAAAPATSPSPMPMTSAPDPKASPVSAPMASPSASPSAATVAPLPGPAQQASYENPPLNLLTWMCRVLAVVLLLAEVAGVFALIVGQSSSAKQANDAAHAKNTEPSVADEVAKIMGKNSTGLWGKVAILGAGAISVVAMLTVAEMIQLAISVQQTALRVEQSAAHVSQTAVRVDQTAGQMNETAARVEQKLDSSRK